MQDDLFGMAAPEPASETGCRRSRNAPPALTLKITQSGAVSLCGFSRFPVTLTKGQWRRMLAMSAEIKAFIAAHEGYLAPDD